jgi:hypothetical protein
MGGIGKCCCESSCCGTSCNQVIDYIEVDITEFTGHIPGPTNTYTLSVGESIIDKKCYLPWIIGQNSIVRRTAGASPCFDNASAIEPLYDITWTITQTGALPIDELSFPCSFPNGLVAGVVVTTSGASRTYYWPSEVYLQGAFQYKGTPFFPQLNNNNSCETDAALATAIKAEMVSALSAFPEMASSNFSVTLTRTFTSSTGSSLALGSQVATRSSVCSTSEPNRVMTASRVKHGFLLELYPGVMKGTLWGSETINCDFATNPPADVTYLRRLDVGFTRSLSPTTDCWGDGTNYSHTMTLASYSSAGDGNDCSTYGGPCIPTTTVAASVAKSIQIDVRIFYV